MKRHHPPSVRHKAVLRIGALPLPYFIILSILLGLAQSAFGQMHAFSNVWSVVAEAPSHPFLKATGDRTRGLDYNPATGHLLVVSREGSTAVHILDSTNGVVLGALPFDSGVISGGNFPLSMIGITTDGVIYVGNLTTDATGANGPFKLYRWANETAQPEKVYEGDPSGGSTTGTNPRRFGDSIAVRGTGASTQILLGTYNQGVGLLTTADGVNFTATKIVTDLAEQDSRWGIAWGAGDTFWVKQGTGNLKNLTLDLEANTAKTTRSIPLPAGPGGPLAVDLSRNLIAILQCSTTTDPANHKLRVFDISNPAAPVQTDTTKDMPAANVNGNSVGAVSLRDGLLFALETNNGIVGYTVHEAVYAPSITSHPANIQLWEGARYVVSAGISGTQPLAYQWRFDGVDLAGETQATVTLPAVTLAHAGSYQVVVTNASGAASSNPGTLTVTRGNPSDLVTNIWSIEPNLRPYLTSIPGYKEYSVAINPANTNVLVLTRQNPTNMLVVLDGLTGAEKHYIDYSGLLPISSGYNKVDVADDGTVYLCNLSTDTINNPFRIDALSDDGPVPALAGRMLYSGDPGNGWTSVNVVWGGTLAVRGSGPETQILLGSGSYNQSSRTVAILQLDNSGFFTSTAITIADAPDKFARLGIDWGPGTNTFWAKSVGQLVLVEFDLATQTGAVKKIYPTTGPRSVFNSITGIKYDPATQLLAGLLNGSPPSPVSVPIYDVSDIDAGPFWVDHELFTTYNADIEYQGNVDLANGYLVALGVNNGVKAFKINAGAPSRLPVILAHPAGATWFASTSPTLSVTADSPTPLTYQWFFNGAEAIPGATSATLTLTNIQLSQAGEYHVRVSNADGYRDSIPASLAVLPLNNTPQMTNIWSAIAGSRPYLNLNYYEYGMAFNPATSNLLVASYVATNPTPVIIAVLDALTGADKHTLDVSFVSGGNRWINKIGVADDGAVYAANRTTSAGTVPFTLYRWADDQPATLPTIAFSGDPFSVLNPNKLCGWTMEVRGAGLNTEILLSTDATNVLSILTTTDGLNFVPNEILVPGVPANFARLGISWGAGNTFWVKTWQGPTYLVQYDLAAATGTVLKTYDNSHLPLTATTLAYNDDLKFLATVARDDQKNVQIYSVADLEAGPQFRDQELFPTYNASIEANGALDFGGNTYLFALNENNGLMAFRIDSSYQPPVGAFKILGVTAAEGVVTLTWESQAGKSYQVMSAASALGPWENRGAPVSATGATASYQDDTGGAAIRFYKVAIP
ncbi:MAG TPA: DUF4623 domain-containing protein [Candidatus Paceibacterota bacterium]|nr:DUF4623 domain-containing protein [Verrucomicrobiota bacterium]HOX01922.1 DUF4623 domain-containing protein [Verrucomicrobiota bacterium]HRZ44604.1 DUF4623 domain-containing protein [Candidatus Paceibacterota bacterium]HRZ92038.1 DUF4623 domain-containing protein [Candidatus Paceibacterota bacterium]